MKRTLTLLACILAFAIGAQAQARVIPLQTIYGTGTFTTTLPVGNRSHEFVYTVGQGISAISVVVKAGARGSAGSLTTLDTKTALDGSDNHVTFSGVYDYLEATVTATGAGPINGSYIGAPAVGGGTGFTLLDDMGNVICIDGAPCWVTSEPSGPQPKADSTSVAPATDASFPTTPDYNFTTPADFSLQFVPDSLTALTASAVLVMSIECNNQTTSAATLGITNTAATLYITGTLFSIPPKASYSRSFPQGIVMDGIKWIAGTASAINCTVRGKTT